MISATIELVTLVCPRERRHVISEMSFGVPVIVQYEADGVELDLIVDGKSVVPTAALSSFAPIGIASEQGKVIVLIAQCIKYNS